MVFGWVAREGARPAMDIFDRLGMFEETQTGADDSEEEELEEVLEEYEESTSESLDEEESDDDDEELEDVPPSRFRFKDLGKCRRGVDDCFSFLWV